MGQDPWITERLFVGIDVCGGARHAPGAPPAGLLPSLPGHLWHLRVTAAPFRHELFLQKMLAAWWVAYRECT